MMGELMNGQLGPEANYSLKLEDGKLVVEIKHDTQLLDSALIMKLDAAQIVDLLVNKAEEMIPGDQKALAEMLKAGIKGAM